MTSEEKKLNVKRIIIFILLAFIPSYALGIAFSDHKGGVTTMAGGFTFMFYPAIANILTRVITKEGVEGHYLKAHFKKNKSIYILAAVMPLIAGFINLLSIHFLFDRSNDMGVLLNESLEGNGMKVFVPLIILSYIQSFPLIAMGFGEEFGWRAYLTPKLEKLMPRLPACCITGVVWALWHAPFIWYGYDFGKDYPGFPYLGILAMCVCCIPLSYVLTWMTEKTKSVYPAAICHMMIDNVMNIPGALMLDKDSVNDNSLASGIIVLGLCPMIFTVVLLVGKLITGPKDRAVRSEI